MQDMTATAESRPPCSHFWRHVDGDCIIQKSKYTLGIIGEKIRG